MRYQIALRITYEYDGLASNSRHLLHLMPCTIEGVQRLVAGAIQIHPEPEENRASVDFFGNVQHALAYWRPHSEIDIALHANVQRLAQLAPPVESCAMDALAEEIRSCRALGAHSPLHFLAASARILPSSTFLAFGSSFVSPLMSVVAAVEAIVSGVYDHMTFDAEATDVDTAPLEAFEQRRGVCQDYAHITIACLRAVGIPAGYVSGFLRTLPPAGQERLAGADAMHAWVRAWCGAAVGWREFDPTNNIAVAGDHIVVAYGRDYTDVAPVKGVSRLTGGHEGRHSVDVIPEN